VIPTPPDISREITCLLGDLGRVDHSPEIPFHPLRLCFLADLSKVLLQNPAARAWPDLATFAFWCRRANLERMAALQPQDALRLGLGLVFHISPSNVPINCAYSWAFAFLAGNSSVVRLPTRPAEQVDLLAHGMQRLLAMANYAALAPFVHLIRYERSDAITTYWLQQALGRIVWGGDTTVAHIRTLPCHPRSREIAFTDRYSLCAMEAAAVLHADGAALQALCANLYNDIYLMDQNACSSPQLVVWVGDAPNVQAAKQRLWPGVAALAQQKYNLEPVQSFNKLVGLCINVIVHPNVAAVAEDSPQLLRVELASLVPEQSQQRGLYGTVHEFTAPSLDALASIVDARYQTLTYFGFSKALLRELVTRQHLAGIDRMVPVGQALDMGIVWDGFDMIAGLSRLVDIQ